MYLMFLEWSLKADLFGDLAAGKEAAEKVFFETNCILQGLKSLCENSKVIASSLTVLRLFPAIPSAGTWIIHE